MNIITKNFNYRPVIEICVGTAILGASYFIAKRILSEKDFNELKSDILIGVRIGLFNTDSASQFLPLLLCKDQQN
jgi:hypothetical protein